MSPLETGKLSFFRELLIQKIESLRQEAERTVGGMTGERENFPDPTDRASLEADRNFQLRVRDRERKLINKIETALRRIDDGTFGICLECGDEISEERLLARPFTEQCIHCKTEQERREKKGVSY